MTTKHTPLPWSQGQTTKDWHIIGHSKHKPVLKVLPRHKNGERCEEDYQIEQANAEIIVTAVNCHDQLLEALKGLMKHANIVAEAADLAANAPLWAYIEDAADIIANVEGAK